MKSIDAFARAAGKWTLSPRDARVNTPPIIPLNSASLFELPSALPIKCILIALVLLLPAGAAFAADFYVPRDCTLPEAITAANDNTATGGCGAGDAGADTIHLTGNVNLGAHLTEITQSLTINGRNRVISGQDMYRCLKITRGGIALVLNDLIISNCKAVRNQSDTDGEPGGAIRFSIDNGESAGSLSLDRVTLRHSQTHDADTNAGGGGLYARSWGGVLTVTINRSAIHDNRTTRFGGGGGLSFARNIQATITNTSIFDNYADQRGGGIFWTGQNATTARSLTLNHVTITNNESTSEHGNLGGGLYFFHGTLAMHNSIIAGNKSTTENGSNCRVRPQSLTFTDRSNNIAGTGSTNCPTISVGGTPVTDAKVAANPRNQARTRFYDLTSGSAAVNRLTTCSVAVDQRGYPRPWPAGGACDIGAIEFGSRLPSVPGSTVDGESDDDGSDESASDAEQAAGISPTETCQNLAPAIVVSNISEGTACQVISAEGYGHPGLAAAKPSSVVDIWGWVTANTRVCFGATSGTIKFVDTTVTPRTLADLPAFGLNGMVCATINGAGQVALTPGPVPLAAAASDTGAGAVVSMGQSLSNCMVRTQYNLNFRAAPNGEIIGGVPHSSLLTALERTAGWFKVDYHGDRGWISAEYVEPKGTCG